MDGSWKERVKMYLEWDVQDSSQNDFKKKVIEEGEVYERKA